MSPFGDRAAIVANTVSDPSTELIGREHELGSVRQWLGDSEESVLLIEGGAGIGKTTIVRWVAAHAAANGFRVIQSAPARAESHLAFATLADLLTPILGRTLPDLPVARRRALEGALLLGDEVGGQVDERAVAFATLGALLIVANERPLLLAVDDCHWIDPSSAIVLAYVARRIGPADGFRLLLTRRPAQSRADWLSSMDQERMKRIRAGPMSLGAVHRIIRTAIGHSLPRPSVTRVHQASGGNPFFAIEMARALDAAGGSLQKAAALWGEEALLRRRLDPLPTGTRRALIVAASTNAPSLETIAAVFDGDPGDHLTPAVAAGIVTIAEGRVAFTHPLIAQAVVDAVPPAELRQIHAVLAGQKNSVEERAFHLARATETPGEAEASALEEGGRSAEARGASAAAADLFALAAELTPPRLPARRDRRMLAAGRAAFRAGDSKRAKATLEQVAATTTSLRHEARWQLGVVLDETAGGDAGLAHFEQALETNDPVLSAAVHRHFAQTLLHTGHPDRAVTHADAAVAAGQAAGDERTLSYGLAIQAHVRFCVGHAGWREPLDEGLRLERRDESDEVELSASAVAADLARLSLDLEEAHERYERLLRVAADQGDVRSEAWARFGLALVDLQLVRLGSAERHSHALSDLTDQTDLMYLQAFRCAAQHAALSGDVERAREVAGIGLYEAELRGEPLSLRRFLGLLGALELSLGDPAAAVPMLARARTVATAVGIRDPGMLWSLVDEVEALASVGDLPAAREVLEQFTAAATGVDRAWITPTLDRLGGVLAAAEGDLATATQLLKAAVDDEDSVPLPLERARTWLLLGRVERRAKQRGRAREALNHASALFADLGTPLWREQAERELARTGGRERTAGLTPTELRVADLVARGATNKEAAAHLYITVSAIEATLSRIYRKLGVRSRSELARQSVGVPTLSESEKPT